MRKANFKPFALLRDVDWAVAHGGFCGGKHGNPGLLASVKSACTADT